MFNFDSKQLRKLEDDLDKIADTGLAFAVGETLKATAIKAWKESKVDVKRKFTLRNTNKWTLGSIIFDKEDAFSNKAINKKSTSVGSIQQYMHDQEFGITKTSKGKKGVPVPTGFASGEGLRANPKKKVPIPANRRKNIRYGKGTFKTVPKRYRNFVKIKVAIQDKDDFVYLETRKREGIYKVDGTVQKPKVKMIWDLTERSRTIPATPWLLPASISAVKIQPRIYKRALIKQLKRSRRFR